MARQALKRYEREDKKPLKRGRNTVMTQEVKDDIIKVISSGCTEKDAYEYAGVSKDAFYNCVRKDNEYNELVKKAHAKARVAVCNKLVELVNAKNLGAIIWWQKNRAGWRDQVETTSDSGVVIQFNVPRPRHIIEGVGVKPKLAARNKGNGKG